ncbi:carboxylesterase/lipase family protein [Mycolicibacter senuensis]|uniref:Carboxylic ester hydrolase n=1 Tax=Mycolicibacter senuensis TaxID=386913 RepID=A0A7I9XRD8_9MYCO|nr:carboxylesterase family protein [Mycolicibacter senuensis]MDQ2627623.1 carboxylesterase family protein [Actinomycetota bacterium]ORW64983.1 carboxylesterase [Mycolicibacter senuensis]GFG72575.1 carboxylic ester hydrolase [Mycolicibacter senuensis]
MSTGSCRRRGTLAGAVVLALLAGLLAGCGRSDGAALQPGFGPRAVALNADVVRSSAGLLRGTVGPDHRLFQGIPYAAAPVGPLRWQPPAPMPAWQGVRDAVKRGPWCIQPDAAEVDPTSEDCLTLNVWTPTGSAAEPLPVMVWIHGGSFMRGAGDIYHAQRLAVRGRIVVVTINYRLGALGFLADPALGEAGNYGLADQQAALRWVRDNVGAFGGDPAKVTIAGESAGGMSVCDHLVAPESAGLFRAAIIQSGPCQAQVEVADARRISRDYTESIGCAGRKEAAADDSDVAACLRGLPADRLTKPLWHARFGTDQLSGPVVGTPLLPADPLRVFRDGAAARVPVLLGVNRDEFTLFVALRYLRVGREIAATEYLDELKDTFGSGEGPAVAEHYPPARFGGSTSLAYAAAATDDIFACLADRMARGLAAGAPVYGYEFADPHAPAPELFDDLPFPIGATHSLEMRYLFDIGGAPPLDAAQRRLSDQMIEYWTGFVVTGAPVGVGQPDWPAAAAGSDRRWMSLRPDGSRMITDFAAAHRCDFWATVRS